MQDFLKYSKEIDISLTELLRTHMIIVMIIAIVEILTVVLLNYALEKKYDYYKIVDKNWKSYSTVAQERGSITRCVFLIIETLILTKLNLLTFLACCDTFANVNTILKVSYGSLFVINSLQMIFIYSTINKGIKGEIKLYLDDINDCDVDDDDSENEEN